MNIVCITLALASAAIIWLVEGKIVYLSLAVLTASLVILLSEVTSAIR